MNETNESLINSFKQFLQTYESGKSVSNVSNSSLSSETSTVDVVDLCQEVQTVVLRSRTTTDSCLFSDHTISPADVEPEVFDWIFYHLDYKKCPHPLAFALASIVARKLGLAETTRESHASEADKSKPVISSNELYSQSLEYLTEYINSWKQSPELAVEIAKEYSQQRFVSSICAIKNIRRKMEDRHVVLHDLNKALALKTPKQYSYYAIFDGHAGVDAASYASAHLHYSLTQSQAFLDGDITAAFKEAFSKTDLHYLERSAREGKKSGSTALCALIEDKTKIFVAWLGDSLAILVKNGKPIDIMIPHKPELEEERKRIEELGGFVAYVDTWRVNGTLAVSRAIGDPEYKPYISSEPDVVQLDIDPDTDFLIMACDGLWDQLTPEEATSLVYEYLCENENQSFEEISRNVATHLSKTAKHDGSSDNITTIVIFFKDLAELRATPFTPLSPKEKNGLNGNHFQYNDFEFTQSAKNPFDMSSESSLDQMNDMNVAKLNFEINDSINSSQNSTNNESKGISNPFSSNDYSYADLNKPFNTSIDSNLFNNESSLLKEPTNSFEINDKLESDTSHTIGNDYSSLQSLQIDSQFNISKLSEISSSFPTQAVIQSDHTLCSTPIHLTDPFSSEEFKQQNLFMESNSDSTDNSQDFMSLKANPFESTATTDGCEQSFGSAKSDLSFEANSFDKTGYQTAYECDIEQHLNDSDQKKTPIKSPINLNDVYQQVFTESSVDEQIFNENQDINDSSGAESVDSFCYEKIGSDLSKISEKVANDYQLQQMYGSVSTDSEPQNESNEKLINEESDLKYKMEDKVEEILDDLENTTADVKQTNADLISEALMSEHMTAEEAQEVAQQLICEQTNIESKQELTQEVDEHFSGHQISFEQSVDQHKNEEMISQSSAEESLLFSDFDGSTAQQLMTSEAISDIPTEVPSFPEKEVKTQQIFENLTKESEPIPEDRPESEGFSPKAENLISLPTVSDMPSVSPTLAVEEIKERVAEPILETNIDEPFEQLGQDIECKELMFDSMAPSVEEITVKSNSESINESHFNGITEIEPKYESKPELCQPVVEHILNTTPEPIEHQIEEPILEKTSEQKTEIPSEVNLFEASIPPQSIETNISLSTPEAVPEPIPETKVSDINKTETEEKSLVCPPPESTLLESKQNKTEAKVIPKVDESKPKEVSKSKTVPTKAGPSKTTKPLTKADPKSKATTTSLTAKTQIQSKPLSKVGTTSRVSPSATSRVSPATTSTTAKSTSGPITKTNARPLASKPANGVTNTTTTGTAARKVTPTAPKTTATASTRTISAPKAAPVKITTTTSRITSSATSTARTASTVTSKAPPKPASSTRPPIASTRTATTTARTASASGTATAKTNGQSLTATRAAPKPTVTSSLTRKTTTTSSAPKPTQSTTNGAKTVSPSTKTSTIGQRTAPTRSTTTTRTTSTAASAKTAKPAPSSLQSKTGVKPISIKGKTATKDVIKTESTAVETTSNGVSKTMTSSNTSTSSKTCNPLKVNPNSLKQELEDAMSLPLVDSNPNYSSGDCEPNIMKSPEKGFTLNASIDSSTTDVNGNN